MAVKIKRNKDRKPVEMEELFSIDDEVYEIPVVFPANIAVAYLRDLRGGAHDVAVARLLERVVGERGMKALAECEDLEPSDLKQLMDVVQDKVLAAIEANQGNSSGRQGR